MIRHLRHLPGRTEENHGTLRPEEAVVAGISQTGSGNSNHCYRLCHLRSSHARNVPVMAGNQKARSWADLQWHYVHTSFCGGRHARGLRDAARTDFPKKQRQPVEISLPM
jgi:hypothetical protein